jgi:hypothetical protein
MDLPSPSIAPIATSNLPDPTSVADIFSDAIQFPDDLVRDVVVTLRASLQRAVLAYFAGQHYPFLHEPTFDIDTTPVILLAAMTSRVADPEEDEWSELGMRAVRTVDQFLSQDAACSGASPRSWLAVVQGSILLDFKALFAGQKGLWTPCALCQGEFCKVR